MLLLFFSRLSLLFLLGVRVHPATIDFLLTLRGVILQTFREGRLFVNQLGALLVFLLDFQDLWRLDPEPLYRPVEDVLVLEATLVVQRREETFNVGVVRLLLEGQLAAVAHVVSELLWVAGAEGFHGCRDLFHFNLVILFIFVAGFETLPRQHTLQ